MAIQLHHDEASRHARIAVEGNFTFDVYRTFLDLIDPLVGQVRHVTVDLTRAEYMDSSALGLLVQLRNKFTDCTTTIRVRRTSVIEQILGVANFHKLFAIEAE